jgi:hypothetical protein
MPVTHVPEMARACVVALGVQLRMLKAQILEFDRRILAWHRSNEICQRLDELPGWNFSAWIGLVPKQRPRVAPADRLKLIPARQTTIILHPPRPLEGRCREARECGRRDAAPAGLVRLTSHPGGVGAPPVPIMRPCQELADGRKAYTQTRPVTSHREAKNRSRRAPLRQAQFQVPARGRARLVRGLPRGEVRRSSLRGLQGRHGGAGGNGGLLCLARGRQGPAAMSRSGAKESPPVARMPTSDFFDVARARRQPL